MADSKKYDWSETDRVMAELRRKLAEEHEVIAETAIPGMQEMLAAERTPAAPPTESESIPLLTDDAVSEDFLEETADTPAEEAAEAPADDTPAEEAAEVSADDTPAEDAAEAPADDTPAEDAPADEVAEAPAADEVPTEEGTEKGRKKRKRKRIPRLADLPAQAAEEPLYDEAREATRRRAAEMARAQESDLFWRRTPKGRVSQSAVQAPAAAAPVEEPAVATPTEAAEAVSDAAEVAAPAAEAPAAPEITQLEIALDLPVTAEAAEEAAPRRRGRRAAPKLPDVEQLTVEGLLTDIFGSTAAWGEPQADAEGVSEPVAVAAPTEEAPAPELPRVRPVRDTDEPILEIDGQSVHLPDEAELAALAVARRAEREAAKQEEAPAAPQEEAASDDTADARAATAEGDAPTADAERVKLFSAFSVRRNKEGALPKPSISRMSAEHMAFKRALEASEPDFKLLVDLDYEEELGEVIGFEKIRDYHERVVNGKTKMPTEGTPRGRRYEYTAHSHDVGISKFYLKQRRRHIVDLAVTLALMILLFVYERSLSIRELFGAPMGGRAFAAPFLLVGLLLFLVGVVLLRRALLGGLLHLCRLTPSDYSLSSVVVIVTLLYHIALFFLPAGSAMTLFLSPAMGTLVLVALSNFFNWYRESCAFRVVSSKEQKYALMSRTSVGNREGDAKRRLFETEREDRVFYVRPIGFVRNYFANTDKKADHQRSFGAEMLIVSALSCALALFTVAFGNSASYAIHTALVTFLVSTPMLTVLSTSLPMFSATRLRLGRTGAIIGESAVYDCGGKTTLVLPDSDCFSPMPHEQFELVKNCDAERATVFIRALLERIGSQLVHSVQVPRSKRLSPEAVTLTDVDAHGVAAVVSGDRKTPILLGDVAYLQRYGIRVSPKKGGRYEELCRNMLCVAIGNRLTALFIARYRPQQEMGSLLEALDAEGVQLVVRTKDPGLHDELFDELFDGTELPVRAMKPLPAESDIRAEHVDATVVAIGSSLEAARTFAVCRRIRRAIRLGKAWQMLSLFVGALLAGTLTFLGWLVNLPAFLVVAYNMLWCGIHALSSYLFLRREKDAE